MKTRNLLLRLVPLLGAILVLGLLVTLPAGCETESSTEAELRISPAYAEIARLNQITLTASGWYEYRWSLSKPDIGNLSSSTGDTVLYTAIQSPTPANTNEPPAEMIQIVTVSATSATNDLTGQARIKHLPGDG